MPSAQVTQTLGMGGGGRVGAADAMARFIMA
jgi:hypothetical protein